MTTQLYRYRVFAHLGAGHYLLLGDADGRNGDHAIDEQLNINPPDDRVRLASGAEFMAVPVSRIHVGFKRLDTQPRLVTLDGLPAEPEEQAAALADEVLAAAPEHVRTVRADGLSAAIASRREAEADEPSLKP